MNVRRWPGRPTALLAFMGLVAAVGLVGPAAADEGESCVRGPARLAGPDRPHVVDPAGDANPAAPTPLTGGEEAYDLLRAWVSQVGETPFGPRFAVHMEVADLSFHPAQAVYYGDFPARSRDWVRAKATVEGTWEFMWGGITDVVIPVLGTHRVYAPMGTTSGAVDPEAGIIRIDFPDHLLPSPPDDGSEVALGGLRLQSGHAVDSPVPISGGGSPDLVGGAFSPADGTANASVCEVVLYEAEDDEDEEG